MTVTHTTRPASADVSGRDYVRADAVKAGDLLQADGGFTCIAGGAVLPVKEFDGALYVDFADGCHDLAGQDDGDGILIGFYPAARSQKEPG